MSQQPLPGDRKVVGIATAIYLCCAAGILLRAVLATSGLPEEPEPEPPRGTILSASAEIVLQAGELLLEDPRAFSLQPYCGGKFIVRLKSGPTIAHIHEIVGSMATPAVNVVKDFAGHKPPSEHGGSFVVPKAVLERQAGSVAVIYRDGEDVLHGLVPESCVPVRRRETPGLGSLALDWLLSGPTYTTATPYCLAYQRPGDGVFVAAFFGRGKLEEFWALFGEYPPGNHPVEDFLVPTATIPGTVIDLALLAVIVVGATSVVRRKPNRGAASA